MTKSFRDEVIRSLVGSSSYSASHPKHFGSGYAEVQRLSQNTRSLCSGRMTAGKRSSITPMPKLHSYKPALQNPAPDKFLYQLHCVEPDAGLTLISTRLSRH